MCGNILNIRKKYYICIANKNNTMNIKQLSFGALMLLSILPVSAQEDAKFSKESYKKILQMEEQSAKYAEKLQEIPSEIKDEYIASAKMNADGRIWLFNFDTPSDAECTFLVLTTDPSAPADSMDKIVDIVYRRYMEQDPIYPIYFFRETLNSKKPSKGNSYTYERRTLLSEKYKKYDKIYKMLTSRERIAPPPSAAPRVVEIIKVGSIKDDDGINVIRMPEVVMSPKTPVKKVVGEELVYDIVEINAEFPGGDEVLMKWLSNNLQYPENCIKKGIKGKVIVSFVVNGNGDVKEVKVVRSPDKELSKEVVRVVKAMPKWNPALQIHNDKVLKTINTSFTLPIFFRLPQTIK
ncbi:MAG: energy transducer TonB [Bacteroidaceae bacterium]|nr:energy transducer TonB [Bacteroidaceae bacterium]